MEEPHNQQTLASSSQPPNHRVVHSFECPDLQDFHMGIVREPWSTHRGDTVVQLPKLTPFDTSVNQLPLSPEDSLVDPADNHLTDLNSPSRSLDSSQTDSDGNSLDNSLPEIPIEMEPVQLMNQLLTQLNRSFDRNPSCSICWKLLLKTFSTGSRVLVAL